MRSSLLLRLTGLMLATGVFLPKRADSQTLNRAPDLGLMASLHGWKIFPADDPWNQEVTHWKVAPDSEDLIVGIGWNKPLHPDFGKPPDGGGIPYLVVDSATIPPVPVKFETPAESDPGPYPIPPDAPIEGGPTATGDRHVIVLDQRQWRLYELFSAHPADGGAHWRAGSGAEFDLRTNTLRPAGWTSADAAGLPIFPGLVRYDEVHELGAIRHALRFTCTHTRRAYVPPARHFASESISLGVPLMGLRVRLKASVDLRPFSPTVKTILKALQTYGMILADNGGDWFLSGTPDARWDNEELSQLKRIKGSDFEVVLPPTP